MGSLSISPPPVATATEDVNEAAVQHRQGAAAAPHVSQLPEEADRVLVYINLLEASVASTTTAITTPTTSRHSYVKVLGQFYMNRTEQEQSAIERISMARKEAADHEKIECSMAQDC